MSAVELDAGRIHYTEAGPPDGRPVVFVHGFLMDGRLWEAVMPALVAGGLRCLVPTWPLGAHSEPMRPGADLTPRGVATIIADFLAALDLRDVVLVGNDSGGALSQVVAVEHPERLGALVLTNCDMFDNFPPKFFKALVPIARIPGGSDTFVRPMRFAAVRRSPLAFGLLSHRDIDDLAREWVKPALADPAIREEIRRFIVGLDAAVTRDAARRIAGFDRPVLFAWGVDDVLFPITHAHRMAAIVPDGRVEAITGSRTLPMLDKPERLAELVAAFARHPEPVAV